MKKSSLTILSFLVILICACDRSDPTENNISIPNSCTFDDRDNGDTVINQPATIVLFDSTSNYFIVTLDSSANNNPTTLSPCNLPDEVKTNGTRVIISGSYKILLPTDPRYPAAPFKITAIRRND